MSLAIPILQGLPLTPPSPGLTAEDGRLYSRLMRSCYMTSPRSAELHEGSGPVPMRRDMLATSLLTRALRTSARLTRQEPQR
jgi:hypothetical protein